MGIQKWQVSIKLGYIVDIKSMVMGFLAFLLWKLASCHSINVALSHYFLTHSVEGFEFDSRSGFSMFECSLEPRGIF